MTASPRRFVEVLIALMLIRTASCVRVVSERVAKKVRRVTRAPVSVLPILVQKPSVLSDIVPKEFRGSFNILSVARLAKEKELSLLVRALPQLEGVDLILVGDGPEQSQLLSLADSLGVSSRVRLAGWKEDVASYYKYANVFVSVSRYEGYGIAIAEAALWGLPIVTTDTGMVGEVLKPKEDVLVVEHSVAEVVEAVRYLKSNSDFARSLGGRAQNTVLKSLTDETRYLARYREAMHTCTT